MKIYRAFFTLTRNGTEYISRKIIDLFFFCDKFRFSKCSNLIVQNNKKFGRFELNKTTKTDNGDFYSNYCQKFKINALKSRNYPF